MPGFQGISKGLLGFRGWSPQKLPSQWLLEQVSIQASWDPSPTLTAHSPQQPRRRSWCSAILREGGQVPGMSLPRKRRKLWSGETESHDHPHSKKNLGRQVDTFPGSLVKICMCLRRSGQNSNYHVKGPWISFFRIPLWLLPDKWQDLKDCAPFMTSWFGAGNTDVQPSSHESCIQTSGYQFQGGSCQHKIKKNSSVFGAGPVWN